MINCPKEKNVHGSVDNSMFSPLLTTSHSIKATDTDAALIWRLCFALLACNVSYGWKTSHLNCSLAKRLKAKKHMLHERLTIKRNCA